jgi:hypothetical protein
MIARIVVRHKAKHRHSSTYKTLPARSESGQGSKGETAVWDIYGAGCLMRSYVSIYLK